MPVTLKYPRARIFRLGGGWTIEVYPRAGASRRIKVTYATMQHAYKAARRALGCNPDKPELPAPRPFQRFDHGPVPSLDLKLKPGVYQFPPSDDPNVCGHCNKPMRNVGTHAADHPGTVMKARAGVCQTAYAQAKRKGLI